MSPGWAEVPYADTHRIGAGASVYEESPCEARLQGHCKTTYGGRTLSLFIIIFLNI